MLEPIHAALDTKALLPRTHLVDCGYTDSEMLVESARDYGVTIVGPVAADPSWQAREATGYENGAFTINWESHTATCPQGKRSRKWQPDIDIAGQEVIQIRFAKKDGFVANFAQEVMKGPLPLSVEGIRRPGSRTIRPQCGPPCLPRLPVAVS